MKKDILEETKNNAKKEMGNEPRVEATWVKNYRNEKKSKRLKKFAKVALCSAMASMGLAGCGFIVAAGSGIAMEEFMSKTDYNRINEAYKQEQSLEIAEQFANNEISYEEYLKLIENTGLSHERYIEEYGTQKQQRTYNNLTTLNEVSMGVTIGSAVLGVASATTGLVIGGVENGKENRRNAQEARINRMLGR